MEAAVIVIVAAAILHEDRVYWLPAPARHHDVVRFMAEKFGLGPEAMREQGFIDSDGRWLRRKPACIIAKRAGQIRNKTFPLDTLFSEDMW